MVLCKEHYQYGSNYSSLNSSKESLSTSSSSLPPPLPLHKGDSQFFIPYSPPSSITEWPQNVDNQYFPSSSLEMALLAARDRRQSLTSQEFPPITIENIEILRQTTSAGPREKLYFARYLLEAVKHLRAKPEDLERAQEIEGKMKHEAIKILKKAATYKAGCAEAQFFLGDCYGHGLHGTKLDLEKAFGLYLQGSKLGHPESTYRVAVCYELGLGVKKSTKYAQQFYRKAATLGDPSAMYKLGMVSLKQQPKEALAWFLRAAQVADEKNPHALHELGLIHQGRHGPIPSVVPDLDYARELFSQAAFLGYAPSQAMLGLVYEKGLLHCPRDPARSIAWYSRAAEQGEAEAELALSGWFFTGAEGVLPRDDSQAYKWALMAAQKNLAMAEYAMGYYTEMGIGVLRDWEEAKRWYAKAADHKDPKAIQRLQDYSIEIKGTKKRVEAAKNTDCTIM